MKKLIYLFIVLLFACSKEDVQPYENVRIKVSIERINTNASGKTYIEHYLRFTSTTYGWDKDTIELGHSGYNQISMPELGKEVSVKVNPVNDSVYVKYYYSDEDSPTPSFTIVDTRKIKSQTIVTVKTKAGAPYLTFE